MNEFSREGLNQGKVKGKGRVKGERLKVKGERQGERRQKPRAKVLYKSCQYPSINHSLQFFHLTSTSSFSSTSFYFFTLSILQHFLTTVHTTLLISDFILEETEFPLFQIFKSLDPKVPDSRDPGLELSILDRLSLT